MEGGVRRQRVAEQSPLYVLCWAVRPRSTGIHLVFVLLSSISPAMIWVGSKQFTVDIWQGDRRVALAAPDDEPLIFGRSWAL